MKRSNLLVCAMLMMCQLSLAQVSRDSAYAILKTDILDSTFETKEIFVSKEVLQGEDTVYIGNSFTVIPNFDCWFFFVDEKPFANWSHDCKYVFINKENGNFVIENGNFPPNMITELDLLNSVLPRKVTDPKLLFNFPSSKSVSSSNNEYAVIISGGGNQYSNYERYWNDCSAIYKALVNVYNYNKSKIFVIMSDGTSSEPDLSMNYGGTISSPLDLDNDGTNDIQYAATKANIAMVFDTLSQRITSDDNVFVFVTDHGGTGSTISLWNNVIMTKTEFASEINKINHARSINICMEQCYSGGYATALAGNNRVIATACEANNVSYAMPNLVYDEFCFHWISAVSGQTPYGTIINADSNNDNFVSMAEAFQYAKNADTRPETPQYSSPANPNLGIYLTLNGKLDVDLYISDTTGDNGAENLSLKYMWNSPDIWIEDTSGNIVNNPIGGRTYNVCVRIHNKSNVPSTGNERLFINWAKAGVNLPWQSGWNGSRTIDCDGEKHMSGSVTYSNGEPIPSIAANSSYVKKVQWFVPFAEDYDCGIFEGSAELWHFCLLARVHDNDTIIGENLNSYPIDKFVLNNNNVAWKNLTVSEGENNKAVVWLQNHFNTAQKFRLHFTAHPNSKNEPLSKYAETYIHLSPNVFEAWASGGKKGSGISVVGENKLRITSDNATLENIPLPENTIGMLKTEVNFLSEVIPQDKTFTFDIAMYDANGKTLYGGEHYMAIRDDKRTFDVVAMQNQTVMAEEPVTFSAVNIGEPATYVWYNAAGDSIASGTTLSTTATQSQQYRLSVQATADGYKGYDTVSLVVRNGAITSLSPNPATNQVVVSYSVTNQVQSGTIQIANTNGITVLSVPFTSAQTSVTLNIQNLTAGQYSVRLVSATGEVMDSKTLIVQ